MPSAAALPGAGRRGTRALLALFAFEAGLLVSAAGIYRIGGARPLSLMFTSIATLCGLVLCAVAFALLVREWRQSAGVARRAVQLGIACNLLFVVVVLITAELGLRLLATTTDTSVSIGTAGLSPTWAETRARNAALIREAAALGQWWDSFFVADPLLGWTAGPNRRSRDGLYCSSTEGIRSSGPDVSFRSQRPQRRVALVGDSYTFSMDVSWEDSWAHHLQQSLGPETQVLNFGIDGYGIDQAYLRYRRDVRPWQPDVVVFGLIQHDLTRTLAVYPFISFGWGFPFAKPRFALAPDGLQLLNTPLISPEHILTRARIADLPFIDYDLGYRQSDWQWRRDHAPLLIRLFQSAVPRWPPADPRVSEETAIALSGQLLQMFRREAVADGSVPLIAYFPTRGAGDLGDDAHPGRHIAREMLAAHAPDHLDLTPCVRAVPPALRFVPGKTHYAGHANAAVARCIASELERLDPNGAGGGT